MTTVQWCLAQRLRHALAEWGSEDALGADDIARILEAVAVLDDTRARLDPGPAVRAFVTG